MPQASVYSQLKLVRHLRDEPCDLVGGEGGVEGGGVGGERGGVIEQLVKQDGLGSGGRSPRYLSGGDGGGDDE